MSSGDRPRFAFVRARELWTDRVGIDVVPRPVVRLPTDDGRVAAVRASSVLVESRNGSWLRLYALLGGRWRTARVADAPKNGRLGRAGLTTNARGRNVVAYAVRLANNATELWLAEVRVRTSPSTRLTVTRTRVTRNGFPPSFVPPAATPLRMPDGSIRIVETWSARGANAIFWRREGKRWWGRVLYASALGTAGLPIYPVLTGLDGDDLFLVWTVVYPAQRELHVLLTSRVERSMTLVVHRNAIAAGLAFGPNGPEVAANENVAGLDAGLVLFPSIITTGVAYSPPVELDGRILGYAHPQAGWDVLLARNGRLEWFRSSELPHVRIFHLGGLTGRIDGAAGGVVQVYREAAGQPRVLVAEAPVGDDGRFSASDPAPVSGTRYRFVYEHELPYSLLLREPVP